MTRTHRLRELASQLALAGSVDDVATILAARTAPALEASLANVAAYNPSTDA